MFKDMFGTVRYKVGLHIHTKNSDGRLSEEDVIERYKAAGYDVIALTDHWTYHKEEKLDGIRVIPGCEFDNGERDTSVGVMHIVGIGMTEMPQDISKASSRQEVVDSIRRHGGIAILAHPAWSNNTPEDLLELDGISAFEIYNTVSGFNQSYSPDSSYFCNLVANKGGDYPLTAADDSHFYTGDECRSYIMAAAKSDSAEDIIAAVVNGDFYATQGPELHVRREGNKIIADSSPVDEMFFISSSAYVADRCRRQGNITHEEYEIRPADRWVRVEVRSGNDHAWSNIIRL